MQNSVDGTPTPLPSPVNQYKRFFKLTSSKSSVPHSFRHGSNGKRVVFLERETHGLRCTHATGHTDCGPSTHGTRSAITHSRVHETPGRTPELDTDRPHGKSLRVRRQNRQDCSMVCPWFGGVRGGGDGHEAAFWGGRKLRLTGVRVTQTCESVLQPAEPSTEGPGASLSS